MLEYFPQLIDGLFLLLGDDHREIRIVCFLSSFHSQETDDILSSFLSEIKSSEMSPVVMNTLVNTLLTLSHHNDRFIRLTSVMWIYEFILLDDEWSIPYARMLRALLPCYADNEADIRTRAEACCRELLKSVSFDVILSSSWKTTQIKWNCFLLLKLHVQYCPSNTMFNAWYVWKWLMFF